MPKTHAQLMREAQALQTRVAESHEALDEIRKLARKYGLRAENVFPAGAWPGDTVGVAASASKRQTPHAAEAPGTVSGAQNVVELPRPPYTDGTNAWNGRGRRPNWLLAALSRGLTLRDLMPKKRR